MKRAADENSGIDEGPAADQRADQAATIFEHLAQDGDDLLDHGFDDVLAIEAEVAKFALRDGVVSAFGGVKVDSVLLTRSGRSSNPAAQVSHGIELAAALRTVKAADALIGENEFEEGSAQATPARVEVDRQRDEAAGRVLC